MNLLDRILGRPRPVVHTGHPVPATPRTRHTPGRPIRLTRQRALALIAIAERGLAATDGDVQQQLTEGTAESVARARHIDRTRAHAADALVIIRDRYTHPDAPDLPDHEDLQLDLETRSHA